MSVATGRRWWGELGGTLHSFKSLLGQDRLTLIRVEPRASCGWAPPGDILESPEELGDRLCGACLGSTHYTKPCWACRGEGHVEVCINGHSGCACPCPTRMETCPECEGRRTEPLSDDEVFALEGYASAAVTP
jgi:hypothetical protein